MAFYYNTTNGPVALNLAGGASCVLPPRQWTEIIETGSSPDLVRLLKRKLILRQEKARREMVSLPESKPVQVAEPTPVVPAPIPSSDLLAVQPMTAPVPVEAAPVVIAAPVAAAVVEEATVEAPVAAPAEETPAAVEAAPAKPAKPFTPSYRGGGSYRRMNSAVSVPSPTTSAKDSDVSDADSEKPNS